MTIAEGVPTTVRYRVLALVFFAAVITYLDRICISAAAPAISAELRLSEMQMGFVFSAFGLAYMLFEVPAGWVSDRWGQRAALVRIVGCWSLFTMLTGAAWNYASLITTRAAFGAAEAGAFPSLSRALARWFPPHERSRANGAMWMGARLGGAIAPPVSAILILSFGWRAAFVVFGAVGLVWCAVFRPWYHDEPAQHPAVNRAELSHIGAPVAASPRPGTVRVPWRQVLLSRNMLALCGMYFSSAFGYLFFMTWLPTYLMREHGLTLRQSGWYAALPLAAGALGCLAGGFVADWLVRKTGSLSRGRRIVGVGGFILGALGFAAAALADTPALAVLSLTFAAGTHDLVLPVTWATCVDVGGRFGATASGYMNMASSLAGMLSPIAAAWLAATFGSFHAMFAAAAVMYIAGGLLWLLIDPARPLSPA